MSFSFVYFVLAGLFAIFGWLAPHYHGLVESMIVIYLGFAVFWATNDAIRR